MQAIVYLALFGILVQFCYGGTICEITREGVCVGGNVSAGVFNETTFNGTVCLQRANFYQNLCGRSGITTARATGSGVTTTVGNYCQITRRGACPGNPSLANNTFRDFFGERNLTAMTEEGCLQRSSAFHSLCGNTGTTTALFGGTGLIRRQPIFCQITRQGNCPGFPNYVNKTFQAIAEEDTGGATVESACLSSATSYQTRCGNTGFTTARFIPSGNFRRVPSFCEIKIEGNCVNRTGFSNKTVQDIAGEDSLNATIESFCLKRAKDYFLWCGSIPLIIARYVPSGKDQYWGRYCLITRNGNCSPQTLYANSTFRAPLAETNSSSCFTKAIDYQCYCNGGGSTIATFSNSSNIFSSTLCCYPPRATCSSSCVDLTSNNNHCGSCGNVCSIGRGCVNSTCVTQCSAPTSLCSGSCVNLTSNNNNCGSCGSVCAIGRVCTNSTCVSQCSAPTSFCSGSCVNLANNNSNCGSCGNVCSAGTICTNLTCVPICSAPTSFCNGSCLDFTSDNSNCGSCGNVCSVGRVCTNSSCVSQCAAPTSFCSGSCVNLANNNSNCGSCGNVCSAGTVCTNLTCVPICSAPTSFCNGSCFDLTSDNGNCGSCGNVCSVERVCTNSSCVSQCSAPTSFCNGSCFDLTSDNGNCGSCGNICSVGTVCRDSACVSCSAPTTYCSGACVDLKNDNNYCGSCERSCSPGTQVCSNSVCVGNGNLRFTINWDILCDVDIFVRTPNQKVICYYNTTGDGGLLDYQDFSGQITGPENIYWGLTSPLPPNGTYNFCIRIWSGCTTINYVANVEKAGVVQNFTGIKNAGTEDYSCLSSSPFFITSINYP